MFMPVAVAYGRESCRWGAGEAPVVQDVVEVTAPIQLAIVGDRLHATLVSGRKKRTYAIKFCEARKAASDASFLLDQDTRKPSNVRPFRRGKS